MATIKASMEEILKLAAGEISVPEVRKQLAAALLDVCNSREMRVEMQDFVCALSMKEISKTIEHGFQASRTYAGYELSGWAGKLMEKKFAEHIDRELKVYDGASLHGLILKSIKEAVDAYQSDKEVLFAELRNTCAAVCREMVTELVTGEFKKSVRERYDEIGAQEIIEEKLRHALGKMLLGGFDK